MNEGISRRQVMAATAGLALASQLEKTTAASGPLVWEQIPADGDTPPARWDHTLIASDNAKALLVFGGRDAASNAFADSWIFLRSGTTWTPLEIAGPSARFGHAVATDQEAGIVYLFGGQAGDLLFNDVWAFDFETRAWTLIHDGIETAPTARYGTSMVWTNRRTLLVSHGFTFSGRFNDTWEFDPATAAWTDRSPAGDAIRPLNRCLHEAVWDNGSDAMLLYGGCSSGYGPCPQGDLWSFNLDGGEWSLLEPANAPSARSNPSMVYDDGRQQVVLLGGLTESGYDSGAFSLSGTGETEWTSLEQGETGPSPRASHDACVTGPNLYLFGGYGDSGPTDDFWLARLDV